MRTFWSYEEIEKLRQARLKGFKAKEIARCLNRTENAVNKALRRYDFLENPSKELDPHIIKKIKKNNPVNLTQLQKRLKKSHLSSWVEMKEVVQWLRSCSITITEIHPHSAYTSAMPFLYQGKNHSAAQILVLANRLRIEQNLLPFFVEGITSY
jgi:IS30 family transposase